ncbi:MAG TPA: dienelactone hydrolase family protein [Steroidobacteraceae bacterium]|jgi:carboxymethylenebutenolidase|nr:dienelactone hydrolase family protein [Steroidobacteraceae bacterium]
MQQSTVSITRADGTSMKAMYCLPDAPGGRLPAVLVIFDVFGMTTDLSRIAGRFVQQGYAVLVPDLFDRPELRVLCVVRALRSTRRGSGREFDDLRAAREFLGSRSEIDAARVAVTGFCMGGGFAVYLGASGLYKVSAPFYGDVPGNVEALRGTCPVIASFGARDAKRMISAGHRLESHLKTLGVPHDVKFYPEAGHSFMNRNSGFLAERLAPNLPIHAQYHEPSAEDAWRRLFSFFDAHMNRPSNPPAA